MKTVVMIVCTVLVALWIMLFLKGYKNKKYEGYISQLDGTLFRLKDLYFIGYALLDMFNTRCNKGFMAKNLKKMNELYGDKFGAFYNYSLWAGKITLVLTLTPLIACVGIVANVTIICVMGFIMGPLIGMSLDSSILSRVDARREEILMEFPQVVSKLAMLLNAGMTLLEAWEQVAYSKETVIYEEMQKTVADIRKGGIEMETAYSEFARRCNVQEVRKFASLVIQTMKMGGSEMAKALKDMADERWQQKKHMILRKGELAGNKLLFPIMLMFVGVLILVMVPAFSQL